MDEGNTVNVTRHRAFSILFAAAFAALLVPHTGVCGPAIASGLASAMATQVAIASMQAHTAVLSGKRGLPFSAQSTCYPGGVPE